MAEYSYAALSVKVAADTRDLTKGVHKAAEEAGEEAGRTIGTRIGKGVGSAAKGVGQALTSVVALAGAGVAGLAVESVKAGLAYNKVYDQGMRAFKAVLGTDKAAQGLMESIGKLAEVSPFPKEVFIQASKQMLAFGFQADQVVPTLQAVQDAVAATGKGQAGIDAVTKALGRVEQTGKFTSRTLTMLSANGINATALLAKGMGVSTDQVLQDMKSKTFDSQKALGVLTQQMEIQFKGSAARVNDTWEGAKNHIEEAMIGIGSAIAEPFVGKNGGGLAVEWGNKFAELMDKLAPLVTPLVNALMKSLAPALDAVNKGFDKMVGYAEKLADPKHLPAATAAVQKYGAAGLALGAVGTTLGGLKLFEELPLIGPMLEGITKPLEKVTEHVTELAKNTGKSLLPKALGGGAEAAEGAAGVGEEAGAAALSGPLVAVTAAIGLFMVASPKFRASVIGLAKDVIGALKPVFLGLVTGFKTIVPLVMMVAKVIGDNLAPIVTRIAALLVPFGKILGAVIVVWFKMLAVELKILMPILTWALNLLGKVLLWLTTPLLWLAQALNWLAPKFVWLAGIVSVFSDHLTKYTVPVWRAIAAAAKEVWGAVSSAIAVAWGAIVSAAKVTWHVISEIIRIAWAVIKTVVFVYIILIRAEIELAWLIIRTVTKALWDWFGPYIMAAWKVISTVARVTWNAISAVITGVWKGVRTAVSAALGWLKSVFTTVWNWLVTFTRAELNGWARVLSAIWSVIRGPITAALAWIKRVFSAIWGWLVDFTKRELAGWARVLTATWNLIRKPLSAALTWVKGLFTGAWDWLTKFTTDSWKTLVSVVTGFWDLIKKPLTDMWTWISGLFSTGWKDIVTAAGQVGGDLLRGLKAGVTAAWKGVSTWVKKAIIDPIVDNVKSFFGISSPSTVFAGIGLNLIQGLFSGMWSGVKGVGNLIAKVFGGMPAALGHLIAKGLVGAVNLPTKAIEALGSYAASVGSKVAGVFGKIGGLFGFGTPSAGVQQWAGTVAQVLAMLGHPELQGLILAQMQTESGGNPTAINLTDSNAAAGHPSQGLMQVIPSTFAAYAGPFRSRGILDPLANIYAGVAYALARYGRNIGAVLGHGHGYAQGGIIGEPVLGVGQRTGDTYSLGEAGPEMVLTAAQLRKLYRMLAHPLGSVVLGARPAAAPAAHAAAKPDAHAAHLAHLAHVAHLAHLVHPATVTSRTYATANGYQTVTHTSARTALPGSALTEQQRIQDLFRAHAQTVINVYPRADQSEMDIARNVNARLAWAAQGGMR